MFKKVKKLNLPEEKIILKYQKKKFVRDRKDREIVIPNTSLYMRQRFILSCPLFANFF